MNPPDIRLISFDIGIKNMAYCIFDIENKGTVNQKVTIQDWNILNLSETHNPSSEEPDIFLCNQSVKKSVKKNVKKKETKTETKSDEKEEPRCNKPAKYKKKECFYCDKHAKQNTEYWIPKKEYSLGSLKKQTVDSLQEYAKQNQYSFLQPETTKLLKSDMIQQLDEFFIQKCFEIVSSPEKEVSANHIDLITIGRNLNYFFSRLPIFNTVTHVVIENQISPIANRMKTIQGMVAQHFIIMDVKHIDFVSSANKLKDFHLICVTNSETKSETNSETKSETKPEAKSPEKYKKNKSDGILFCHHYMTHFFSEWKPFFESYPKKKDDLADCFLQGIWYITKKFNIVCGQLKNK